MQRANQGHAIKYAHVNYEPVLKFRRWNVFRLLANAVLVHKPAAATKHVFAASEFGFLMYVRVCE